MDELEISGKRYISSRRAAKENNYTSDYIGQLIRSKKVIGQKVGRSWYVSEESLRAYFSGEQIVLPPPAQVAKIEPEPIPEATPEPVVLEEVQKVEAEIEKPKEKIEEEIKIPITITPRIEEKKSSGLVYMADDAPLIPELSKSPEENEVDQHVEEYSAEPAMLKPRRKNTRTTPIVALISLAVLTFALVSALSYFFIYDTVIDGEVTTSAITFAGFR